MLAYIYIAWLFHGMSAVPTEVFFPLRFQARVCCREALAARTMEFLEPRRMVPRILVEMWISGLNGNIVAILWAYI